MAQNGKGTVPSRESQQDREILRVLAVAQRSLNIGLRRGLLGSSPPPTTTTLGGQQEQAPLWTRGMPIPDIVDAVLGTPSKTTDTDDSINSRLVSVEDLAPMLDHVAVLELDVDDSKTQSTSNEEEEGAVSSQRTQWISALRSAVSAADVEQRTSRKVNWQAIGEQYLFPSNRLARAYRRKAVALHPDKIEQVVSKELGDSALAKQDHRVRAARVAFEILTLSRDVLQGRDDEDDSSGSSGGNADDAAALEEALNGSTAGGPKPRTVEEQLRMIPRTRIVRSFVEAAEPLFASKSAIENALKRQDPAVIAASKINVEQDPDAAAVHVSAIALLTLCDIQQRRQTLVKNLLLQRARKEELRAKRANSGPTISGYIAAGDGGRGVKLSKEEMEKKREERVRSWRDYQSKPINSESKPLFEMKRNHDGIDDVDSQHINSISTTETVVDGDIKKKKKKKKKANDDPLGVYS